MVSLPRLLADSGGSLLALLVLSVLAAVVALGSCIAWALGRRVPPVLPLAAFSSVALVPVLASAMAISQGARAAATASADSRMAMVAGSIFLEHGTRVTTSMVLTLPLLGFIVVAALIGGRRGPRRIALPALVAACTVLMAGASAFSGLDRHVIALVNPAIYLLAGLCVALGLSHAPDPEAPPARALAAAAAAMALPLLVCLGETTAEHLSYLEVFEAIAVASADYKAIFLRDGLAVASQHGWARGVAVALSALIAMAGAIGCRPGTGVPVAGTVSGLISISVGVSLFYSAAPALYHLVSMEL